MPKSPPTGRSRDQQCPKDKFALLATAVARSSAIDPTLRGSRIQSSVWDYGHVVGDEHKHIQAFDVRRAAGAAASRGADGDLIITG